MAASLKRRLSATHRLTVRPEAPAFGGGGSNQLVLMNARLPTVLGQPLQPRQEPASEVALASAGEGEGPDSGRVMSPMQFDVTVDGETRVLKVFRGDTARAFASSVERCAD